MPIETPPKGLSPDDVMAVINHPSFRAAVERQVHAKLVALGVAKPGAIVAVDEQGKPLPGQAPTAVPQVHEVFPKTARQRAAEANGWVSAAAVRDLLAVTGARLSQLQGKGLLVSPQWGYYTAESVQVARKYMLECGMGTDGWKAKHRERIERLQATKPTAPKGYLSLEDAATLYGKSRSTIYGRVKDYKLKHQSLPYMSRGIVYVEAADLAKHMSAFKGRSSKKSKTNGTTT